jgi:hypothetical protein
MLSKEISALGDLLLRLKNQCLSYIKILRDGQDTNNRDFIFKKHCEVNYQCSPEIKLTVTFEIPDQIHPQFTVGITYTGTTNIDDEFGKNYFDRVFGNGVKYEKTDKDAAAVSVPILKEYGKP